MNDSPSALLAQGQAAARAGDREHARNAFYAVIDREPDNLDAWLWLGAIAEDPEDSVAYLQRALEINPRSVRARHGLEWAKERLAAEKPSTDQPDTPPVAESAPSVLPGVDTSGMQPMTQPLAAYQQSASQPASLSQAPAPQPPPATPESAPEATDQLDWDAIMARLQAGEDAAPAESDLEAGKRLIEAGEFANAAARLRNAVAADPRNIEAYEQLGVACYQIGDARAALDAFRQVVALDPQRAEAHANIGFIQTEIGDIESAVASLRRSIELSPTLVEAMIALGDILRGQGNWDEALEVYERAVKINAEIPEALFGLALCRDQIGQRPEAIFLLRRATELRPDYQEAWSKLRELE